MRVGGNVAVGFFVDGAVAEAVFSNNGVAEACNCGETVVNGCVVCFIEVKHPASIATIATDMTTIMDLRVKGLILMVNIQTYFD